MKIGLNKIFLRKVSFSITAFLLLISSSPPVLASSRDKALLFPYYSATSSCGSSQSGIVNSSLPETVPEPHRSLFTQAATAFNTSPVFLSAIFLSEHDNVWSAFDTAWASSPKGASGPFQFMPATWSGYKTDGNNDGSLDVNNIYDAAFSAANLLSKNGASATTPLGDINQPFSPGTLLFIAAGYNWGGGNVQRKTSPNSPLNAAPKETQEYLNNIFSLINSGFSQAGAGYSMPRLPDGGSVTSAVSSSTLVNLDNSCSGGVISGNIVETALNLAWSTRGHGPQEEDAKPEYKQAMPLYNGSKGTTPFSDCGVFVATVMIASGADVNYPKRGTSVQLPYLREHPEKYLVFDDFNDTSQLLPGDILIFADQPSGHTYIYVGPQPGGYNSVSASLGDHVPEASGAYFNARGNHFTVARLIK